MATSRQIEIGSRMGYRYEYGFSVVEEEEIVTTPPPLDTGDKYFFFQFRVRFTVRKREGGAAAGDDVVLDRERYNLSLRRRENDGERRREGLRTFFRKILAGSRLRDYWMSDDEITDLCHSALEFAAEKSERARIVPVAVELNVCSVQKEGETFEACRERAIVGSKLLPLYLYLYPEEADVSRRRPFRPYNLVMINMPRIRVEHVDRNLMMEGCTLCKGKAVFGDQLSFLTCGHVFHSRCIARRLEHSNLCPTCSFQLYSFDLLEN
ncbi:hypothetical protein C2S51_021811 [Perilla frutescens var. frutescens]|nr:hypothetical protein C2S51_021811 [Perilla frutescens var. frutescens]